MPTPRQKNQFRVSDWWISQAGLPQIIDCPFPLCLEQSKAVPEALGSFGITPKPRCWTLTCFPWQPEQHLQGGGTSWELLNPKTSGCEQTSCSWGSSQGVQDQAGHTLVFSRSGASSTSRSFMDHSQGHCCSLRGTFPAPHFWPVSQKNSLPCGNCGSPEPQSPPAISKSCSSSPCPRYPSATCTLLPKALQLCSVSTGSQALSSLCPPLQSSQNLLCSVINGNIPERAGKAQLTTLQGCFSQATFWDAVMAEGVRAV